MQFTRFGREGLFQGYVPKVNFEKGQVQSAIDKQRVKGVSRLSEQQRMEEENPMEQYLYMSDTRVPH